MAKQPQNAITPTRAEDYPEWYQQVVKAADLAETSPVRGCMVIKPWGYALWENMQRVLDGMFKATGHKNAYFPLFIPLSFLEKEAAHVEGFAKECAVVTHHRLEAGPDGRLHPKGELEEPLIVRPTSETIIGASFAKWVQSYRDLPLLINQWCNVVRWELRTRLFLRTTEFLWQEGHTVHATEADAREETMRMLAVYADFAENWLAMPVIQGEKTASERFPGAVDTYCIEAMMQDRKALQAGTSHFLGQNFAKASQIKFLSAAGREEFAWTTSWGMSTRMIGALLMTHSDDDGLVLPPKIAPAHVAILPVLHQSKSASFSQGADSSSSFGQADPKSQILEYCHALAADLRKIDYHGRKLEVELDTREGRGGDKVWEWIKKGVPIRLEIGPRDIGSDSVFVGRRDKAPKDRTSQPRQQFLATIAQLLDEIQQGLLERAKAFRAEHTREINSKEEFYEFFTPKGGKQGRGKGDGQEQGAGQDADGGKTEIHGGFALAHWNGSAEVEAMLKKDLNVTIRCIPLAGQFGAAAARPPARPDAETACPGAPDPNPARESGGSEAGTCPFTGDTSPRRVVFGKAY